MSFGRAEIGVTDFDDVTTSERVLEFRMTGIPEEQGAFAAIVIPHDGRWEEARLSIAPQVGEVSAALVWELIEFTRKEIERSQRRPGS